MTELNSQGRSVWVLVINLNFIDEFSFFFYLITLIEKIIINKKNSVSFTFTFENIKLNNYIKLSIKIDVNIKKRNKIENTNICFAIFFSDRELLYLNNL